MKLIPIGPNQNLMIFSNKNVFFSYQTPVAAWIDGKHYRTAQKWSVTTSKHINKWLAGVKAEERDQSFFDNLISN